MKQLIFLTFCASSALAQAQGTWVANLDGKAGPSAIVELTSQKGETRLVSITFEYARKCDPGFSHLLMQGRSLSKPESQRLLPSSHIGGILNGKRYTGPAVLTLYSNAVDTEFAMPYDMAKTIAFEQIGSISFVTPKGDEVRLPTVGLRAALDLALDACQKKHARNR